MPLQLLKWEPTLGPLPAPNLKDDSHQFPVEVVKEVRRWLESTLEYFQQAGPTPQIVTLSRQPTPNRPGMVTTLEVRFHDPKRPGLDAQPALRFDHGTAEIILVNRTKTPIAKFHFLVARTEEGLTILGPQIKVDQVGRV